ncbi:hypothetical protein GRF29_112g261101 [Pseudopithomyces chartarum]|uniref:Uncharacterized protein n=1 Tax=Pseudopithomyces chartarum TaxID=1892770 RepID=A0AAN6LS84_9PLEO|nr:hypothetical protein GRF29_112g261101 [Pseudopithomyces chartarum]
MSQPQSNLDLDIDLDLDLESHPSYTNPHKTLDDLLGPLEIALSRSNHIQHNHDHDHDLDLNPITSIEPTTEPHLSTSPVSSPTHAFRNTSPPATHALPPTCPLCTQTLPAHDLLPHLHSNGPPKCTERWRCLSVVEKKSLCPEYNIRPYENILAQMASYSEYEPSQHLTVQLPA